MKLLLSSNSTLPGEPYLLCCQKEVNQFFKENKAKNILFIPYAGVTLSFDEYLNKVIAGLNNKNITITSLHNYENKITAISEADAIMVGGGNSFNLLNEIYLYNLLEPIQQAVKQGTLYIGWSAGSNLACPTIKTTNDMPIVYPPSFNALNLIPFQFNPHYLHGNLKGHNGETREQRIEEFLVANPNETVIGLREGTMFKIIDNNIQYIGDKEARIFKQKQEFYELQPTSDFNFLIS
jgi:dipeptidase E